MSYPYLEEIKKLFVEKKPNVVYGFNYIIKDYKNILELWKKYLITKKIICPFEYEQTLKNIFEFHKTTINHVIIVANAAHLNQNKTFGAITFPIAGF